MSKESSTFSSTCGLCGAAFLLRLWVAVRLLGAGFAKFRDPSEAHGYSMDAYKTLMGNIAQVQADNTFMPLAMTKPYSLILPWVLISLGFWLLIGAGRQLGLFLAGATFLSLCVGVTALPDDTQSLYLGLHVGLCAAALAVSKYDCLSLDGLLGRFSKKN